MVQTTNKSSSKEIDLAQKYEEWKKDAGKGSPKIWNQTSMADRRTFEKCGSEGYSHLELYFRLLNIENTLAATDNNYQKPELISEENITINEENIWQTIVKLKNKKAAGPDQIIHQMLKYGREQLVKEPRNYLRIC